VSRSRVVITGLGAITPLGMTVSEMWAGLCAGKVGINTITTFDPVGFTCKIAGQVPEYNIRDFVPKSQRKATKLMSRDIELSVIAALEAITDSGLITYGINPEKVNINPQRIAINLGAGLISCDMIELAPAVAASITDGQFDIRKWGKSGLELVTPLWLLKYLPNMLACHVGIIHDIQGPSNTITCAETSSHLAIAEACHVIARGSADYALAGGAEAKVNPIAILRQCLLKRANIDNNDNPAASCRPFDANAKGCIFGEASGIIVLENFENAQKRGAKIYSEIAGIGESTSINPAYEHLEPDGFGLQVAIEKAIAEAQIEPDQLDLIIPHGTGIPSDDIAEAKAIHASLGEAASEIPVWPTKSMLSNTGATAGSLDVIAATYAINEQKIPSAKNCENIAHGCNLNIVRKTLEKEIKYALSCSYTYGGHTAAVVLKKVN
jgi:3-oxoacyl-[acyl-carrier-protein] synthase II